MMAEDGIAQPPLTKRCSRCGEIKEIDGFSKSKRKKSGYCSQCKSCAKVYYESHKDDLKAYYNAYTEANRDKIRARKKAYHEAHKEEAKEHRECRLVECWVIGTANNHKRRGYEIVATRPELLDMARNATSCPLCGTALNWGKKEKGHLIPESPTLDRKFNGNRISKDNSWIICHRCNSIKHTLPMPEFVSYCKMIVDKFGGEYL